MTASSKASHKVGAKLIPKTKAWANQKGRINLLFPFSAGIYNAYGCTDIAINESYAKSGGLRVNIVASQKWFCAQQYYTRFDIKPRTNSNTEYKLSSNGHFAIIRGTSGAITGNATDTYFGFQTGEGEIYPKGGQSPALVQSGQVAKANEYGVSVFTPEPDFWIEPLIGDRAKFYTSPSNQIEVNGETVRAGQVVWHPRWIKVTTLTGKKLESSLSAQWPKQ